MMRKSYTLVTVQSAVYQNSQCPGDGAKLSAVSLLDDPVWIWRLLKVKSISKVFVLGELSSVQV